MLSPTPATTSAAIRWSHPVTAAISGKLFAASHRPTARAASSRLAARAAANVRRSLVWARPRATASCCSPRPMSVSASTAARVARVQTRPAAVCAASAWSARRRAPSSCRRVVMPMGVEQVNPAAEGGLRHHLPGRDGSQCLARRSPGAGIIGHVDVVPRAAEPVDHAVVEQFFLRVPGGPVRGGQLLGHRVAQDDLRQGDDLGEGGRDADVPQIQLHRSGRRRRGAR